MSTTLKKGTVYLIETEQGGVQLVRQISMKKWSSVNISVGIKNLEYISQEANSVRLADLIEKMGVVQIWEYEDSDIIGIRKAIIAIMVGKHPFSKNDAMKIDQNTTQIRIEGKAL